MIESYFKSSNQDFTLLQGNCCKLLRDFDFNLIVSLQTRHIFFQMEVLVCRAERL